MAESESGAAAGVQDVERPPSISVVIPVRNGALHLARCLLALNHSVGVDWECVVVDDGSADDSAAVAAELGAQVIRADEATRGPGQARNLGARWAKSPILLFIDADVVVRTDTLSQFVELFERDPTLTAAFGSYDAAPDSPSLFSQYRNLLHHFVHQTGQEHASTFWSGCGAIRRDVFLSFGGFDPEYVRPSIEDIDLGYRLSRAGLRVRLAKHIQVMHLKSWTFWSIVRTDVTDRALPWTALIRRTGTIPNDLNLQTSGRLSAVSVYAMFGLIILGIWVHGAWLMCIPAFAILAACNRNLYKFFVMQRGWWFFLRVLPLHILYFGYSGVAFAFGMLVMPISDVALTNLGLRVRQTRTYRHRMEPGTPEGDRREPTTRARW